MGRKGKSESAVLEGERERRVELHEALKHRCLVITGDPGSGKTTFLNRIANLLCRVQLGKEPDAARKKLGLDKSPFPILIRIADLAAHIANCRARNEGFAVADSPAWLTHFLAATSDQFGFGLNEAFFRDHLRSGSAMVLLDGLDEVPTEQQRHSLSNLIHHAGQAAFRKSSFVVTSRPTAYRGETVLPRVAHVHIEDLEENAIKTFLARWCEALFGDRHIERKQYLDELLAAYQDQPEIRRMARNPVMLTALAVVHWNEKRLPEQRADLYESILRWLARSRKARPARPSPDHCINLHQELALAMQDHPDGRQAQIPRFEAAQQIAGEWRHEPENRRIRVAEAFLDQEELDSGIVVRRGDYLRFWHLTFQEYLAARALASRTEDEQRKLLFGKPEKLYQPEWRETVLLAAGVLHHDGVRRVRQHLGGGTSGGHCVELRPYLPMVARAGRPCWPIRRDVSGCSGPRCGT